VKALYNESEFPRNVFCAEGIEVLSGKNVLSTKEDIRKFFYYRTMESLEAGRHIRHF
jgi:hypothetical protein